jgi:hypothetical protein
VPALTQRQLEYWRSGEMEREALRRSNPEWDLMSRTFSVLAFANLALEQASERPEYLAVIDRILTSTIDDERVADVYLLPYVHSGRFRDAQARSLFVEGEVALMLAARQTVQPAVQWQEPLRERVERIAAQLERGPVLSGESYPDEAWTFCNTIALAALRASQALGGPDHSALLARWVATAKARLLEPRTGLLVSSFTWQGAPRDGPEGSSLWLAAHMLQLIDAPFAADQYRRARQALVSEALGFAWAREWPEAHGGPDDVDSGPTVPLVQANAGSSGLLVLGAAAFDDEELLTELVTSLRFAAFPVRRGEGLAFAAGNQLADAVLLYALVQGPLWRRLGEVHS